MRFAIFLIALAVAVAADTALMPALELGGATPSAVAVLATFAILLASRDTAWFAGVVAGLAVDLSSPLPWDGRMVVVLGPWAIGFAFGAQLLLTIRGSLVRRNPLTIAVACFVMLMAATVVWCAVWSLRAWLPASVPPWGGESVMRAMAERSRWALWSGVVALPLGWLLLRTVPIWSFPGVAGRTLR